MMRVVRADNPSPMTLDGTRTFVVGVERPVVIDPGPALPDHLRRIHEALGGRVPVAILLTHAHPDHAEAAPALARGTGAPLCMAGGALALPFAPGEVGRWLADGEVVETDAGPVRAVATPGHAPEHLCFHWPASDGGGRLFVGDLFMGQGDTTLVAPPEGDLGAYLRSLDRVERLAPRAMHPAHGPTLDDPAATIRRYRAHREERIVQVREALRVAPDASVVELVDRIYGAALHPGLREAAAGSVRAIVAYLRGPERRID